MNTIQKDKIGKQIGNYLFTEQYGWLRTNQLDRECIKQRERQLQENNSNCRRTLFDICTQNNLGYLRLRKKDKDCADQIFINGNKNMLVNSMQQQKITKIEASWISFLR